MGLNNDKNVSPARGQDLVNFDTTGAAQYLGCSKKWLELKRLTGGGPRFFRLGRAVRYRLADLQAYVEENLHEHVDLPSQKH